MSLPRLDAAALHAACAGGPGPERVAAYEQLGDLLLRVARARVRNRTRLQPVAEECVQEALVTIWQHLEAGRGPREPEAFVSWSTRIVVHKLLDAIRALEPKTQSRRAKRVALSKQSSLERPAEPGERSLGETLPDNASPGLEERAALVQLRELLARIPSLDVISEKSRTVLARGYLEGLADDELADLLDTTRANVHVIRCRDLQKLRADTDFMARLRELHDG